MSAISEWLIGIMVIVGALLSMLSAFGLLRLPDVYLRSHAAAKSATFGILCILSAAFIYFWLADGFISAKLLLGILFVFITAPVAGHLLGRAAYSSGVPLWSRSVQDDLAPVVKAAKINSKQKAGGVEQTVGKQTSVDK